jgi:hypothetical protein
MLSSSKSSLLLLSLFAVASVLQLATPRRLLLPGSREVAVKVAMKEEEEEDDDDDDDDDDQGATRKHPFEEEQEEDVDATARDAARDKVLMRSMCEWCC